MIYSLLDSDFAFHRNCYSRKANTFFQNRIILILCFDIHIHRQVRQWIYHDLEEGWKRRLFRQVIKNLVQLKEESNLTIHESRTIEDYGLSKRQMAKSSEQEIEFDRYSKQTSHRFGRYCTIWPRR